MNFKFNPLNWENRGVEPSTNIKTGGFLAGYKPPADYFNYKWNRDYNCIKELQENLSGVDDNLKGVLRGTVVASYNSAETIKAYADYVCGEENAQTVLNTAFGNGGRIVLTEGSYNCSSALIVDVEGTEIVGCGFKTVLNMNNAAMSIIGDYVKLSDFKVVSNTSDYFAIFSGRSGQSSKFCDFDRLNITCTQSAFVDNILGVEVQNCGIGAKFTNCIFNIGSGFTACDFVNTDNKFYSGNRVNGTFNDNLAG